MHGSATRAIALAFAVLLVTAPVGSAMAAADGYPPDADDRRSRIAAERLSNLVDDRSPIERKAMAVATVRTIDAGARNDTKARAVSRLNGTLSDYRDGTRISTPRVFLNDTRALFALSSMAGGPNDTEIEAASLLVYEADNDTAATAIADARRALERARNDSHAEDSDEREDRDERGRGHWKDDGTRRGTDGRDGDRRADRSDGRWDGSDRDRGRSDRRRADRSRDRSDRDGGDRAQIRMAAAHIRSAERALERANRHANASDRNGKWDGTRWRVKSRAAAIPHVAVAWWRAQQAIDALDSGSEPDVRIVTRRDPLRNGSAAQTREVVGTVYDPRAYELSNATVTVGGNRTKVAPLNTTTAPGTNATFRVNVTVERRVTTVEVSVEDAVVADRWFDRGRRGDRFDGWAGPGGGRSDERDDGRPDAWNWRGDDGDRDAFQGWRDDGSWNGNGPWTQDGTREDDDSRGDDSSWTKDGSGDDDRDRHSKRSRPGRETGRDVLSLDGDRLTDAFERQVVGTDPQDPDSDAATTDVDEAGNGVVDGDERFGPSTLPLFVQHRIGADPFTNDTDDDGLTDEFELTGLGLLFNDVGTSDFDGDGVPDAEEDPDNDTLTNAREQDLGTDPLVDDTDDDGLADSAEVLTHGTIPTDQDSDDDGLVDGEEVALGTDPLVPDDDGDGVPDGNETYTTTATNETLGTSVALSGRGNVAGGVTIEDGRSGVLASASVEGVSASSLVRIESEREFENATVTLEYDESRLDGNESNVSVFTFNRTLRTFVRLNSTVDATNDTVSAVTPHFSIFVAFDSEAWGDLFPDQTPSKWSIEDEFDDEDEWDGTGEVDGGIATVTGSSGTPEPSGNWPTAGYDHARSRSTPNTGPAELSRNRVFPADIPISAVAMTEGDLVVVTGPLGADRPAQIARFENTSEEPSWNRPIEQGYLAPTPTIHDETIYIVNATGTLLALDAETGQVQWSRELEGDAGRVGPQTVSVVDGLVVAPFGQVITAVDARNGSLRWQHGGVSFPGDAVNGEPAGTSVDLAVSFERFESPLAAADGTLYAVNRGHVIALNATSGAGLWATNLSIPSPHLSISPRYTPTVTDDSIYVVEPGFGVHSLDRPSGTIQWSYDVDDDVPSGEYLRLPKSVAATDDRVYLPAGRSNEVTFLGLTSDGDVDWKRNFGNVGFTDPIVDTERVYFGDNYVWGLDAETGQTVSRSEPADTLGRYGGEYWKIVVVEDAVYGLWRYEVAGPLLRFDDPGLTEPTTGHLERTIRETRSVERIEEVRIQARVKTTLPGDDAAAALTLATEDTGPDDPYVAVIDNGTGTGGEWENRSLTFHDVSRGDLTVGLRASGGATLEVDALRVAYDTDGDGLTDNQETEGITNGLGETFETDPEDADTDDDGLPDGDEVGEFLAAPPPEPTNTTTTVVQEGHYPSESDPTASDTDGDGLTDYDEGQIGTNPSNPDTDHDGTIDSRDSDPFNPPPPEDSLTLAEGRALVLGAVMGEVGFDGIQTPFGTYGVSEDRNSPYYLAGWLIASIVPLVDIVADVRDLVTNVIAGDPVEAALDAAGLIPVIGKVGDGAKAAKVIAKWLRKFPAKTARAAQTIGKYVLRHTPDRAVRNVLGALGMEDHFIRLANKGLTPGIQKQIAGEILPRINDVQGVGVGEKLTEPLSLSDVSNSFVDATGTRIVIVNTDKWNNVDEVLENGPGLRHVIARHGNPESGKLDDFPVAAGSKQHVPGKRAGELFPDDMGIEGIEEAIEITAKRGDVDGNKITYSGPELNDKFGIDEMFLLRSEDGLVVTAYPKSPS